MTLSMVLALLKMYFTGQPSLMNVIRGSGRLRVRD